MKKHKHKMDKETKCVHNGTTIDTITRGVNTPIFPSTAHEYLDSENSAYPRHFNTLNQKVIEQKISQLEGAQQSIIFSSGMAAISTVLLTLLKPGDHIVLQDEIYGGSHVFAEMFFNKFDISYTFVATNPKSIKNAIKAETKLIFIESPTNPLLSIINLKKVAKIAKKSNCLSVIDNTFATPIFQNPIAHGIDVVIHSGTKYLGGHSDLSSGAVATSSDLAIKIRKTAVNFGGNVNPLTCYLLERSLKTLSIRVNKQAKNALKIAKYMQKQAQIKKVYYPGLPESPGHKIAKKQMSGFGAMLAFELNNSNQAADVFMKRLKLIIPAISLGGVETTICDPATTSHQKISPKIRERLGISKNLLRLSVGIENSRDLINDIDQALKN